MLRALAGLVAALMLWESQYGKTLLVIEVGIAVLVLLVTAVLVATPTAMDMTK